MQNFGGGVIMISHNAEFYGALCTEKWHIADGKLKVEGGAEETELKVTRKKTEKEKLMEATESKVAVVGAVGNLNSVEERQTLINPKTGRPLSKKEIRAMAKQNKK
mmetsp:Transcript_243/g.522  ORF Transcript_243/g.522 Transcript_243/m.522 type:complete len:106 (-) Transcript_243:197-514(-)